MAQQERARRTRELFLDAAAEEFALRGYADTTLHAVVARTDMTKGALYGHFPSKEHIAGALVQQALEAWRALRRHCEAPDRTAAAALEALALGLADRLCTDVRFRAALRLTADRRPHDADVPDVFEDARQCLIALVHRAQHEGAVRPHPPEVLAQLLLVFVYGTLHASRHGAQDEPLPGWEEAWRVLIEALSVKEHAGKERAGSRTQKHTFPKES
ncbi:TetR/AcrR family transcriptional regulator [Streptomyces cinnamoneus]|uniref:TetR family transcriptional regulator n=1 Tax=Streptomyces cinnamoneus TaxID=53446 RepID=A0A918WPQ4_STRCJ|nr:TetR/AcrR family transcriptional regulator [Streptomyces cinnamoneus]GHC70334.1 TetR family transcriptional regulator [Streptomyces cinnamoneus]